MLGEFPALSYPEEQEAMAFIHLIFILHWWWLLQGINSIDLLVCPTDPKSTSQPGKKKVLEQRAPG